MDECGDIEKRFPYQDLLQTAYFSKHKAAYISCRAEGFPLGRRNYVDLLRTIKEIHDFNAPHAHSYAKRLRSNGTDWKNCEAVYSEAIVYHYYIRPMYEELIRGIELDTDECDIIIRRLDGSCAYLEVFCIMPNIKVADAQNPFVTDDINVHTQTAFSSVRQKLLRKIHIQGQLSTPRDNFAVIDLNESLIANEFTILSSLSDGYKIHYDPVTRKPIHEGYDWRQSVFDDESTRFLKAVIFFYLGNYESRKYIFNNKFKSTEQGVAGYRRQSAPPA